MTALHVALSAIALGVNALAALWGGWRWWRIEPSRAFWVLARAGQAAALLVAAQGGILYLRGDRDYGSLHLLYGVLPIVVSFLAEALRASSAEAVLQARGLRGRDDVARLPEDRQRLLVLGILRREMGVMAAAAAVVVALLVRAWMTGAPG
jgi:hypothetical protein